MSKKKTHEEVASFIKACGCVLLSNEYKNSFSKLLVQCPQKHQYEISWDNFKHGYRCPECAGVKKKTISEVREFIISAGYELLSEEYKNAYSYLTVRCPQGHQYETKWGNFQSGSRCSICGGNNKKTINDIELKIKESGSQLVSTKYKNSQSKLIICCSSGHKYETNWNRFQQGHGCPQCAGLEKKTIDGVKIFIEKTGHRLLSTKYENSRSKLLIECPQGHQYETTWSRFHLGQRCSYCAGTKRKTTEEITDLMAKEKYTLLSAKYCGSKSKLNIRCDCGHEYQTIWNVFQQGHRCPACANNASEQELEICEFVKNLIPNTLSRQRPSFMQGKELDVYVPEKNFAIEYNGLYWHSSEHIAKSAHREKFLLCKAAGVHLFTIFEDEWRDKRPLIEKMIEYRLGCLKAEKVRASRCEVRPVPVSEEKEFYNRFHLAGYTRSTMALGLYYEDRLVSCLTFRKPYADRQKGTVEIARFANDYDYVVHGAFAKLFAVAKKELTGKFERISTYSDCRLSWGEVYLNNGFTFLGHNQCNYWYVVDNKREFRYKHRRTDKWNEFGKTEKEQNHNQGWYEIFDCGHYKWELSI